MLGQHVEGWERLVVRDPAEHRRRGIDVRDRTLVTSIDLAARRVHWRQRESGVEGVEPFDWLAYATGARDRQPDLPGVELGYPVFTPRQALALGRQLPPVRRAVIAGGGFIGLEMAEALRARGLETVLLSRSTHLLRRTFDPEMAAHIEATAGDIGVDLRLESPLEAIERSGDGVVVHTPDAELRADIAVLAIGSEPNAELAAEAGIPLGRSGAVAVDHYQRTSIDGVFAAGDCAEAWDVAGRRWANWHLGTVANKAGRVAGRNIAARCAGRPLERFPGAVGTAIARFGRTEFARTGLTEEEARALGFQALATEVESTQIAGYMPAARPIHVKLIHAQGSGRVLGGQIVGGAGAGKRIDVVATAVTHGLTLRDLLDADLAYAPPFSTVWDPLQRAARTAFREEEAGLT